VGENGGRAVNFIYCVNSVFALSNYFIPIFFRLFFVLHSHYAHYGPMPSFFSASFSRGGPWSEVCVFTFTHFIFESSLLYSLIVTVLHSLMWLKVLPVSSLCLKVLQVSLFNINFAFFSC